jgi:hypothetical protein
VNRESENCKFIWKIVDVVLYGNIWIAVAALAMSLQTSLLLSGNTRMTPAIAFIFFATLFLYSLHRLVGMSKSRPFQQQGRHLKVFNLRFHLVFFAIISGAAATWFLLHVPFRFHWAVWLPCLAAGGYVLPVLRGKRRLRDLNYAKVFLVSVVWAWITVVLPAMESGLVKNIPMALMAMERALFIFAIALPFDIRDIPFDEHFRVKTIPSQAGARKAKWLAASSLSLMLVLCILNYRIDVYSPGVMIAMAISLAITFLVVIFSNRERHDYYFTGLLDGMMVVQFVSVWLARYLQL